MALLLIHDLPLSLRVSSLRHPLLDAHVLKGPATHCARPQHSQGSANSNTTLPGWNKLAGDMRLSYAS